MRSGIIASMKQYVISHAQSGSVLKHSLEVQRKQIKTAEVMNDISIPHNDMEKSNLVLVLKT